MMGSGQTLRMHGVAAFACWAIHGGNHVLRGTAHDLLWACNVAVPMLAIGCFLGARVLCAVAVLWLSFGTPIWLLDLATGANVIPTSVFVHVAAPIVGIAALRRLGWPRGAWLAATGGSVVLLLVTRLAGSPRANVNLAFKVHDGWERYFPSHPILVGLLLGVSAIVFFLVDRLAAHVLGRRPAV